MSTKADRYEGIDGLKAYAILGIALMHVLSNGKYETAGSGFQEETADSCIYKPRFPFYDGQRFGYVLWLLPENHRPQD